MERVGMRQLRHGLRAYLGRVQAGERFEVTEFGRPVAELRPIVQGSAGLDALVAAGLVSPPTEPPSTDWPAPYPAAGTVTATQALLDERRADPR